MRIKIQEITLGPLKASSFEDDTFPELPYCMTMARVRDPEAYRQRPLAPMTSAELQCATELITKANHWIRAYATQRIVQREQQQANAELKIAPEQAEHGQLRKTHKQEI